MQLQGYLALFCTLLVLCVAMSMLHLPASSRIVTLQTSDPCNYYTAVPIVRTVGKHKFSIKMLKKPCKMAIGYSFSEDTNERKKYMTPSYTSEGKYLSMGTHSL